MRRRAETSNDLQRLDARVPAREAVSRLVRCAGMIGMIGLFVSFFGCANSREPSQLVANVEDMSSTRGVPTPRMAVVFRIEGDSRVWEVKESHANPFGIITQMVPEGDSLEAWTEMVSEQISFTPISVREAVEVFVGRMRKADAEILIGVEPGSSQDSYLVTYSSKAADEASVRMFMQGPDGIYMFSYLARPSTPGLLPRYRAWREIVSKTRLVPNPRASDSSEAIEAVE